MLFLDEPTSGLDSFSAFNLVNLLKQIASNCAILCTIHQPSSEVFFLFDVVIFMKDGQIFYQGPVSDIMPYFEMRGQNCPENYNPADFVMNLCESDSAEGLLSKGLFITIPDQYIDSSLEVKSSRMESENLEFIAESGFVKQVLAISYREAINTIRDKPAMIARVGVTVILNLLYGLIFLNAGSRDNGDYENFNAHVGAISLLVIFSLFGSGQSVLLAFPFERPMILREYVTGTYGILAYFLSKIVIEIPITFLQMLLQYIIAYFMIDLQGNFIFIVLAAFGLGMVSNSVAMGLGCLIPDVKDVTEMAPLAYVPQILFAGFFIRTSQIPIFLRWAQYLCGMKYAMNLIIMTEFRVTSDSCQTSPEAIANCQNLIELNDIKPKYFYIYIIILAILCIGFRILGGIVLLQKAKRFY